MLILHAFWSSAKIGVSAQPGTRRAAGTLRVVLADSADERMTNSMSMDSDGCWVLDDLGWSSMILDDLGWSCAPPLGNRKPMDIGQLDHSWWWPGQITPVCQKFRGQHWPELLGGLTWLMNDHYTKQVTPFEILCSKVSLESNSIWIPFQSIPAHRGSPKFQTSVRPA